MSGPDVGELLAALGKEGGADVVDRAGFVPLAARMETLRTWLPTVASEASSAGSEASS
jgi:hypothetical protein